MHTIDPASDPTIEPAELARIAAERPEARSLIALNPQAYPDLLDWLGSFAEPEIRAALVERGSWATDSDRRAAVDPLTAGAELARIAQNRSDLWPLLASNTAAYPGLVDWLASVGDAHVAAAIARRADVPVDEGMDVPVSAVEREAVSEFVVDFEAPAGVEVEAAREAEAPAAPRPVIPAVEEVQRVAMGLVAIEEPGPPVATGLVFVEPAPESLPESAAVSESVESGLERLAVDGEPFEHEIEITELNKTIVDAIADAAMVGLSDEERTLFAGLERAAEALKSTFTKRWNSSPYYGSGAGRTLNLASTLDDLTALNSRIANERMPRSSDAKAALRAADERAVIAGVNASIDARWTTIVAKSNTLHNSTIPRIVEGTVAELLSRFESHESLLAAGLPQGHTGLAPIDGATSVDPSIRLGYIEETHYRSRLVKPAVGIPAIESSDVWIETRPQSIPFMNSLSDWPSFVTDSSESILSFVLQTLAALPPRQVKLTIFDPVKLGDSVRPLYAINEAAADIWGQKVHTSANELGALLGEIEDHITYVTQKYLGNEYSSLHEYNLVAGDVAEPHRILTIFDFPSGFMSGQGYWNDEMLERLVKIVRNGPRCGVLTIVHAPKTAEAMAAKLGNIPKLVVGSDQPLVSDDYSRTSPRTAATVQSLLAGDLDLLTSVRRYRRWRPEHDLDDTATRALLLEVEKRLASSSHVAIDASAVAKRAQEANDAKVKRGLGQAAILPQPGQPETWWHHTSEKGVTAAFGRLGAAGVAEFVLDSEALSHALLGGRPGSGKSVLLHALIHDLTSRYSPTELELYLLDFKQGVEFKVYATGKLPHARVVAVDAEREFGLSVLESLEQEVSRRGALFRSAGVEQVTLAGVRAQTGAPLPRIVAVIDEFHVLFEQEDEISRKAGAIVELLVRQGRAFGIHCVLASQSLSGVNLANHVLKLIPVRIALMSNEADSLALLGDDNGEARLLSKPGEGILNNQQGRRDANERFQSFYSSPEEHRLHVAALREKALAAGINATPTVFDGQSAVPLLDHVVAVFAPAGPNFAIPVGLPGTLHGVAFAELRREPGANLLIASSQEEANPLLGTLLATAWRDGVRTEVLDLLGDHDVLDTVAQNYALRPASAITVHPRRKLDQVIAELAAEVDARIDGDDYAAETRLLVLSGAHRARGLDAESDDDDSPHTLLTRILTKGPEVGMHVIVWSDSWTALSRRLGDRLLKELSVRIVARASETDSEAMLESTIASDLRPFQLILDDFEMSKRTKVRGFKVTPEELAGLELR